MNEPVNSPLKYRKCVWYTGAVKWWSMATLVYLLLWRGKAVHNCTQYESVTLVLIWGLFNHYCSARALSCSTVPRLSQHAASVCRRTNSQLHFRWLEVYTYLVLNLLWITKGSSSIWHCAVQTIAYTCDYASMFNTLRTGDADLRF